MAGENLDAVRYLTNHFRHRENLRQLATLLFTAMKK